MPEAIHTLRVALPPEAVWDFVKDMNKWAPMLTGYQKHTIVTETKSLWTLKGDVGILSRTVELEVNITEWAGPDRVRFTLTGLNEAVSGEGQFEIRAIAVAGSAAAAAAASAPVAAKAELSWWQKLVERFARWFLGRQGGGQAALPAAPRAAVTAGSELAFTLMMEAGGPTAPLVNAMLEPALIPATEDLAQRIVTHLEKQHGLG